MDIIELLSAEFEIKPEHARNVVKLIDDGNTIPFIARYRKEMHGACDDQVLREFADRLAYMRNITKRKEEVRSSIEGQGKWTDEIGVALEKAQTLTEVEDVYRPFKQKKKTRAMVAVERGLEPLADIIQAQNLTEGDPKKIAENYVDHEKEVKTAADALAGASDIIAERISDDPALRKALRALLFAEGRIAASFCKNAPEDKAKNYETYKDYDETIKTVPPHRILALNRGEAEECLKVSLKAPDEQALAVISAAYLKSSIFNAVMTDIISDAYDRLIFPSLEREVRGELTEKASEQAIKMFEVNLRPLLLQPPLKGKVIMGLDPAYRTGCKIAVIDREGNYLAHTVVYPTPPKPRIEEAKTRLKMLIDEFKVDVISIGNGTASKESEIFVAELIKELDRPVVYAIVNEAGASVYSASKLGAEEFPELDVSTRSAISIARRLLDPLAELIKIDVKAIGVGQYQHDMPQKRLSDVLGGVVEDCVNSVGVDLNTASVSLLSGVAGLNSGIAKSIVEHRKTRPFRSRGELLQVAKLGPKAYEQCAGFLRISDGESVLDNTGVHPESYAAAEKLLKKYGYTDADVKNRSVGALAGKVKADGEQAVADEIGVGVLTLTDMLSELGKPGRDIREELPPVVLRADLLDLADLKEGMELDGVVRNVIDFGVFVDIGVHHDGLVHISEISDGFIKHPSEVLKVGDRVKVKVIGVDVDKNRINLSIKQGSGNTIVGLRKTAAKVGEKKPNPSFRAERTSFGADSQKRFDGDKNFRGNRGDDKNPRKDYRKDYGGKRGEDSRNERSLDEMLSRLQKKFNKYK